VVAGALGRTVSRAVAGGRGGDGETVAVTGLLLALLVWLVVAVPLLAWLGWWPRRNDEDGP